MSTLEFAGWLGLGVYASVLLPAWVGFAAFVGLVVVIRKLQHHDA